jgi:hypothetical protein
MPVDSSYLPLASAVSGARATAAVEGMDAGVE